MDQDINTNEDSTGKINPKEPLISIIVVTYNSAKYILETLESAKAQTYKNIELIVSDDCSTDDTVTICGLWLKNNKERFVRSELITSDKNTGISANCNRGFNVAQGEWIKYIAGDDTLEPNCIEVYLECSCTNRYAYVFHSNAFFYANSFEQINLMESIDYSKYRFNNSNITVHEQRQILLRLNPVIAGTVFIHRTAFNKAGLFDEENRNWEDRPMWLKFTSKGIKMHFVDKKLINYRLTKDSITENFLFRDKLYSDFELERDKIILKKFISELPFIERYIKTIEIKRKCLLQSIGLNKNNFWCRACDLISRKPLSYFIRYFNRSFILDRHCAHL